MAAAADSRAEKQLEAMYKSVDALKDVDFHKFYQQIGRQEYAYGWPGWILDEAVDQPDNVVGEEARQQKNVYMIFMNKCDGHQVENVLENVLPGDARTAWRTIYRFFHKDTVAGKAAATKAFYTASMSSSNTNIVESIAEVNRRAKVLASVGGQVDDAAILGVFLQGMLSEFGPIKTVLHATPNLTLEGAKETVLDFADNENLTLFVKGGSKSADRIFPLIATTHAT